MVVNYVGNDGAPFARGDLDFDNEIDTDDWQLFRAGWGGAYPSLSSVQAYQMGDLDGDLDNDLTDFRSFERLFNAANGANALANLMAVPEPSTLLLFAVGGLGLLAMRRRRAGRVSAFVVVLATVLAATSSAFAATVDTFDVAGTTAHRLAMD